MSQQTNWWWIRHAPAINPAGTIYGQGDVPSDTDDPPTYAALARLLPANAVLITSHLQRTHQTAAAIAAAGLAMPEALIERDLAEQNFGDWQGKKRAEIFDAMDRHHPFWLTAATTKPPGGESFADVAARVARVINRVTESLGGKNIIAVAHGGTIRAAIGHALDLSPDRALGFEVDNCSATRITHHGPSRYHPDGTWAITHLNQRAAGF